MLVEIKHEAIRIISHVQVQQEDHTEGLERQRREELARQMRLEHQDAAAAIAEEVTGITEVVNEPVANHEPVVREGPKIGRNELDDELGIQPLSLDWLISIEHTYPEKIVLLDVWIVRNFGGKAHAREGQAV